MTVNLNRGSGYVYGRARPAGAGIGDTVNEYIDAALKKAREGEVKRNYLGASRLGEPCARKLAYEYRGDEGAPFSARTLRIFAKGHVFEDLMIEWLRAAGFDLKTRNKAGGQFGFETMGGRVQGHIDAVILSGPVDLGHPYPLLFECKSLNDKSWSNLQKNGLEKANNTYFVQCNIYMGYLDLPACLFSALNKNTAEIYHEFIRFNSAVAQQYSDRAVDIITTVAAGYLPPRITDDPEFYLCRWCDYKKICWTTTP